MASCLLPASSGLTCARLRQAGGDANERAVQRHFLIAVRPKCLLTLHCLSKQSPSELRLLVAHVDACCTAVLIASRPNMRRSDERDASSTGSARAQKRPARLEVPGATWRGTGAASPAAVTRHACLHADWHSVPACPCHGTVGAPAAASCPPAAASWPHRTDDKDNDRRQHLVAPPVSSTQTASWLPLSRPPRGAPWMPRAVRRVRGRRAGRGDARGAVSKFERGRGRAIQASTTGAPAPSPAAAPRPRSSSGASAAGRATAFTPAAGRAPNSARSPPRAAPDAAARVLKSARTPPRASHDPARPWSGADRGRGQDMQGAARPASGAPSPLGAAAIAGMPSRASSPRPRLSPPPRPSPVRAGSDAAARKARAAPPPTNGGGGRPQSGSVSARPRSAARPPVFAPTASATREASGDGGGSGASGVNQAEDGPALEGTHSSGPGSGGLSASPDAGAGAAVAGSPAGDAAAAVHSADAGAAAAAAAPPGQPGEGGGAACAGPPSPPKPRLAALERGWVGAGDSPGEPGGAEPGQAPASGGACAEDATAQAEGAPGEGKAAGAADGAKPGAGEHPQAGSAAAGKAPAKCACCAVM